MSTRRSTGPNAEVSEGIESLGKSNAKLERMLAKIGTRSDTPDFRDRMHLEQTNSTAQVKQLMQLLKQLNREGGQAHNPTLGRLTQQFDREFKRFQNLNQQMDQKQVSVIDAVRNARSQSGATPASYSQQQMTNAAMYDEEDPLVTRQHPHYENGGGFGQQQQQQLHQPTAAELDIQFIEYDIEELERRQREIVKIEHNIQEVSEMYKDLALMVNEQQEHINTIDASIVQAKEKTEAGHKELLVAEDYQKKSRKKKCCMLFILLAVIAVIVIIVEVVKK